MQFLITAKASINDRDSLERTPLHLAAEDGHSVAAQVLINAKADLDVRNKDNETPSSQLGWTEVSKCYLVHLE